MSHIINGCLTKKNANKNVVLSGAAARTGNTNEIMKKKRKKKRSR